MYDSGCEVTSGMMIVYNATLHEAEAPSACYQADAFLDFCKLENCVVAFKNYTVNADELYFILLSLIILSMCY